MFISLSKTRVTKDLRLFEAILFAAALLLAYRGRFLYSIYNAEDRRKLQFAKVEVGTRSGTWTEEVEEKEAENKVSDS